MNSSSQLLAESADSVRSSMAHGAMTAMQCLVVALCFLLNMIDGMDVLVLSFAAPVLAEELAIPVVSLGQLFSSGLVGMAFGCLLIGPLADSVGRKVIMLTALALMSIGMLSSSLAGSLAVLLALRFVTGVGVGALLVSMAAMAAEYSNDRNRSLAISLVQAGYPIGATLTGFFAAWAIPAFGWRSLFVVGGTVSLLMAPVILAWMPESLEFLTRKQPARALERINKVMARMAKPPLGALPVKPDEISTASVRYLLTPQLWRSTLLLWGGMFVAFAALYFLSSWIPHITRQAGLDISRAIYAGTVFNIGGFVGTVAVGWLATHLDLRRVMMIFFIIGAAVMMAFGTMSASLWPTLLLAFMMGMFVQGAFNGFYAAAARLYATEVRATGVGWAVGLGRAGAIVGPLLAGLLLSIGIERSALFLIFAAPLLFAAYAARFLRGGELR